MTTVKKNTISIKIAAFLAFFIGAMSVFAGSKVLFQVETKEYDVLLWLVSYNVVYGIVSIITAYLIWKINGKKLTYFILISHFLVFLYLNFISTEVASESIKAMVFRTSIWLVIAVLLLAIPTYINKQKI